MDEKGSLTITGAELFNMKVKTVYERTLYRKQREQLQHLTDILQSCNMILKPGLQNKMDVLEKEPDPLSYIYDDLSSKEIHAHFVDLMEGKLK